MEIEWKWCFSSKTSQTSQRQSSDYKLQNTKSSLHDPPPPKQAASNFFWIQVCLGEQINAASLPGFFQRRSSLRLTHKWSNNQGLQLDGDPVPDDDPEYFRVWVLNLTSARPKAMGEWFIQPSQLQTGICSGSVNTKHAWNQHIDKIETPNATRTTKTNHLKLIKHSNLLQNTTSSTEARSACSDLSVWSSDQLQGSASMMQTLPWRKPA